MRSDQRQDHQHVEQHRELELVAERSCRPGRASGGQLLLAERDVATVGFAALSDADARSAEPNNKRERERDLHEQRQKNGGNRHQFLLANGGKSLTSSCPAWCRASTSFCVAKPQDVDGRDKPGHDGEVSALIR